MVALHQVPLESAAVDPSIPDDDLVIALGPDATLVQAGADALAEAAGADEADAWFGDIDVAGTITRRSAWSPTRLIADGSAASPVAVRAGWLRRHGMHPGAADLTLRLARSKATVVHVTAVLTRHASPPTPPSPAEITDHLAAVGIPATHDEGRLIPFDTFAPEVTVVIPTAGAPLDDGTPAIDRLLERLGDLPVRINVVIIIGDEYRGDAGALEGSGRVVVRRPPGPFNFSAAVNLGVLEARSELVLLLNDDTEPDGHRFIDQMAVHLADPGVAGVGALLTYPNGTVQHAGVVIDDARPLHSFVGWNPSDTAPHGGHLAREVVAVTGGCLLVRRADYLAVGGLSTSFPLSFNDVDLCIRLGRAVGRIVIEPAATLVHHETLSREPVIAPEEWDRWIHRWGEIVDPWYHPGHRRPDDPHALARNADHLTPDDAELELVTTRRPLLASIVHRGRLAPTSR